MEILKKLEIESQLKKVNSEKVSPRFRKYFFVSSN